MRLNSGARAAECISLTGGIMKSLLEAVQPIQNLNITRNIVTEDGKFPNNALLPLLHYENAVQLSDDDDSAMVKEILETNGWTNSWIDGIYDYHHYHSTAHEVLVALRGSAHLQFGGPNGIALTFAKGDVIIIPAGVAHMKVNDADGFSCLGAYPDGQQYDMKYGRQGERPGADEIIHKVPLPQHDPLYGNDGPLIRNWVSAGDQNTNVL